MIKPETSIERMMCVIFLSVRYDSDNPRVMGDVGMAGVAIDSVEDMKVHYHNTHVDTPNIISCDVTTLTSSF